jgi:hypothetical protein
MGFYIPRRALSADSSAYKKGLHRGNASGLPGVDPDLVAENIKWNTTIFGVLGTMVIWRWTFAKSLAVPTPTNQLTVAENHAGGAFDESFALSTAIPSIAVPITELSYVVFDDCDTAWDESVSPGVVCSADAADKKYGTASNLFTVDAAATVGQLATNSFGPVDARAYNYVKFWIKSSVNITSGDLQYQLDDTPGCVSPLKEINIGALTANTWTEKILALGDASGLSAVCSHCIAMDIDKGAFTLRVDQFRFTKGG